MHKGFMTNFKGIGYIIAFGCGLFCFWIMKMLSAGFPNPPHPYAKPIPIEMRKIADKDKWILNFRLFAIPHYDIDSRREYVSIIIRPKQAEIMNVDSYHSPHRFVISGLEDNDTCIALSLDPKTLLNIDSESFISTLLDFEGSISGKKRVILTSQLFIDSDQY